MFRCKFSLVKLFFSKSLGPLLLANVCRLSGVVVIDAHIRDLMIKNCPRYQPKTPQPNDNNDDEVVEEEPVEGGLNFDEFVAVFDIRDQTLFRQFSKCAI